MNFLQAAAGVALITAVFVDLVQTILVAHGGGWLGARLSLLVWRPLGCIHRRRASRRLLSAGGPTVLLACFNTWFMLLWAGWSLVFASANGAVVQSTTRQPADISELIYFVGFTIITLGVGDYVPQDGLWQILTVIASASGFFLVTLVITYAVPVVSAVVEKREVAAYIHGLGRSPRALLDRAWSGSGYTELNSHLMTLTQKIRHLEKQHLAYPLLHHFHGRDRNDSLPLAITALDEALSILMVATPREQQPPDAVLVPAREAVSGLLSSLEVASIKASGETPPLPLLPQRSKGRRSEMETGFRELAKRRSLLLSWVRDDWWSWPEPR